MTSKKRWNSATETSPAFFPKNKYNFNTYLVNVGDFVRTHPMSYEDRFRFKRAAYDWAWHKRYKVRVNAFRKSKDTWEMQCTLTSKVFGRDFL
jgi:hypothetical protein